MLQPGVSVPHLAVPHSFEITISKSEIRSGFALVTIPMNMSRFYDMRLDNEGLHIKVGPFVPERNERCKRQIFFLTPGTQPSCEFFSQGLVSVEDTQYAVFLEKDRFNSLELNS